jgi:hypothetical protein
MIPRLGSAQIGHANDLDWMGPDENRTSDHGARSAVFPLPKGMAQHRQPRAAPAAVVALGQDSPQFSRHTQCLEHPATGEQAFHKFDLSRGRYVEIIASAGEHPGEDVAFLTQSLPLGVAELRGETPVVAGKSAAALPGESHELLRIAHRQAA